MVQEIVSFIKYNWLYSMVRIESVFVLPMS